MLKGSHCPSIPNIFFLSRFDDIYLGIVAKKLGLDPFHSPEFYFHRKPYRGHSDYEYVVASHGFSDPQEMERLWTQQKEAGHA